MQYYREIYTSLRIAICFTLFIDDIECACNFGQPPSGTNVIENGTSYQYIIPAYKSSCCGILQRVDFRSRNYGLIDFQIWRETATNDYTLMHSYNYYVPEVDKTLSLYTGDDMLIQGDDIIGWYSTDYEIVPYSTSTSDQNIQLKGIIGFSEGDSYTLNTPFVPNRNYHIRYFVADSTTPHFTNLPQTTQLYETVATGTSLYTVSYSDANAGDIPYLTIKKVGSSQFSLDISTGIISTAGPLTTGTYNARVQVRDPCGKKEQQDLTVQILNMPPEILNLPSSVDLSESTQNESLLYTLTLRDQSGNDTVTCSLNQTSPAGAPFVVKYISGTSNIGIFSLASPNFDYDNSSSYEVMVDCTDSKDTVSNSLFVYLIKNAEPLVHNLPNVITIPSTTAVGTIVFVVNSTDAENDQLIHTLNYCTSCPFTISQSGHIFLQTSIANASKFSYNLYVVVSDRFGSVTDKLLTILVTGVNSLPVVSNLDQSIIVPETITVGTVIFTALVSDVDNDPLSYQYEYSPVETMSKFTMEEASGQITVLEALDYETGVTMYNFSFTVSDGKVSAPKATLRISIQSKNEPPVFANQVYQVSRDEGSSGDTFPNPGFIVSDPDTGDTWTYKIAGGDFYGRFWIDPSSGILQFNTQYIVDKPNLMLSSVNLIIAAVDQSGASGTTTLSVTITDSNNRTPYFPNTEYRCTVIYDVPVQSSVAYITASDDDFGPTYNQISYSIKPELDYEYFDINANALLTTLKSLKQFENSTKLYTVVKARDKGNRESSVTVTVIVQQGTGDSFFDDPNTVAWFAALMVMLVILLAVAIVCLYRFCKYGYVFSKKGLCRNCRSKKVHFDGDEKYQRNFKRDSRVNIVEWSSDNGENDNWMPSKFDNWNHRANTRGLPTSVDI